MRNTIKLLGITALVAAIVFSMSACDTGNGGTGGGRGSPFNGTWVSVTETSNVVTETVRVHSNGNWERTSTTTMAAVDFVSIQRIRGTYTTSGDTYNATTTHIHSDSSHMQNFPLGSGWHTMEQYHSALEDWSRQQGMSEEAIDTLMDSIRNPPPWRTTFAIEGDTLTFTHTNLSTGVVHINIYQGIIPSLPYATGSNNGDFSGGRGAEF